MPPTPASVVEQWLTLPRTVLQDKVRQVVKRRDADAKQIWAHVRANSVLAAQVRGVLSALRAEVKGARDEVMWTMWIDQARAVLDASSDKPEKAAPVEKPVPVEKAEKAAAPVEKKAEPAEPEQPAAAGKTPNRVSEVAFTPQPVEKPRTAPPVVPPVMFQAPGS